MSGAPAAISAAKGSWEIPWVLDGVALSGPALCLGRVLDRGLLDEVGWDSRLRVLFLPAGHRLLSRPACRAGCGRAVHAGLGGVCHRCFTRASGRGLSAAEIAAGAELPAPPVPAQRCAVAGCERRPTARQAVLCTAHAKHFRDRRPQVPMEQFLVSPAVRPMPRAASRRSPSAPR